MNPYYENAGITIFHADVIDGLRAISQESINCCITSPPYWGLRDYGTGKWTGGLPDCDHTFTAQAVYKDECRRCGAKRVDKQIGIEATPQEYVAKMVEVFEEVRRVLKPDGTLWLNLGDSYATGAGKVGNCPGGGAQGENWKGAATQPNRMPIPGLKPKDLCGIPWRVAFSLQDAGWWLRSDIIWAKPAPVPESVTDRPTRSHEYIFLLAKSEKYYCDMDLIKEPSVAWVPSRPSAKKGSFNGKTEAMADTGQNAFRAMTEFRNKRDVWTVNTDPFPEAHFATFPPALILSCVLAGCPAGGAVLDPFMGAATTALVAKANGRRAIGIELSEEYCEIAAKRLSQEVMNFG